MSNLQIEKIITYRITDPSGAEVAEAEVVPLHGTLFVQSVQVDGELRGYGWGQRLLEAVIVDYGDQDLYLFAQGFGGHTMTNAELMQWYSQFGFEPTEGYPGGMRRAATQKGASQ